MELNEEMSIDAELIGKFITQQAAVATTNKSKE